MKSAIPRLVPLVALTLALVSSAACSSDGTTPTTAPTSAPPTTTAISWTPDGVISNGEYSATQSFTSGPTTFTLHWKTDTQYIYMAMEAPVTGYIAVALDPDIVGGKTNTDMIFGIVVNGQATVSDEWATTESGSNHPSDTSFGGTNNIVQSGGSESGGKTIIEFKRLLNTGDAFDHPFVTGANRIMWAVHATLDDLQFHTAFGRGTITIS